MWRGVGGIGLAGLAIATAVLACRQLVGITDNPPTDLTSTLCGLPYGTNACASCVSASCCAESSACAQDPVCTAYEGCLGQCNGDPKCRSECTSYPVTTASDVSALSACLASKCESACGLTCGGIANLVTEPPSAASCQSCIEATPSICADARAWGTSVEGDAYWRCALACPTPDCRLTCATDHDAGAALFSPFLGDFAGLCAGPCAYGGYWACVGHVNWPAAKSTTYTLSTPVVDYSTGKAVPGLDVSMCTGGGGNLGCPCDPSSPTLVGHGQTDDAGILTLQVQQVIGANRIAATVCMEVTSPTLSTMPDFEYTGYPVSEQSVVISAANAPSLAPEVITPAEFAIATAPYQAMPDTARGFVGAFVFDCLGFPAPEVTVTTDGTDPLVSVKYSLGGDAGATGSGGRAFVYHVPPGFLTLTATPLTLRKPVAVSSVNVAAGTVTGVEMYPYP